MHWQVLDALWSILLEERILNAYEVNVCEDDPLVYLGEYLKPEIPWAEWSVKGDKSNELIGFDVEGYYFDIQAIEEPGWAEFTVYAYYTNSDGFLFTDSMEVLVSHSLVCSPTSIKEEIQIKDEPAVFPNPAIDQISVKTDGIAIGDLTIYSLDGNLVKKVNYSANNKGNTIEVSVADLKPGSYLVLNSNGGFMGRFIKAAN